MKEPISIREEVIKKVIAKSLKQSKAAIELGVSIRHIKRLCHTYRLQGAKGLLSKKEGQPSVNHFPVLTRNQIIKLAKEKYRDFGPTFMSEKLLLRESIKISKETLRQILIAEHLWKPKKEKQKSVHQRRERRACFGELVQIDGSPHAWFEERGSKCCLIVFIDDATSKLIYLQFEPVESTVAYLKGIKTHLNTYGIPGSYYSDKHSIFKVNKLSLEEPETQFERACKTLGIKGLCANTPQAKGRVERVNQTLQDRLVKEMRLAGINTLEQGNEFLKTYIPLHNQLFAIEPQNSQEAHLANIPDENTLSHILSIQSKRKLSKSLELSFNNTLYQILNEGKGRRLQQSTITVCERLDGTIELLHNKRRLEYKTIALKNKAKPILDEKTLNPYLDQIRHFKQPAKPANNHPWRKPCLPHVLPLSPRNQSDRIFDTASSG